MNAVVNAANLALFQTEPAQSESVTIIPAGSIGGIDIQVTIEEIHEDALEVTEHPVQSGASITDHSFKRPVQLALHCGWSNARDGASESTQTAPSTGGGGSVSDYVSGVYSQLLALQASREPFSIVTTIRNYDNMLLSSLRLTRDEKTSQALMVTAACREVILVSTQVASLPAQANQANPKSTAATRNVGPVSLKPGSPSPGGSLPPGLWGNQA